MKPAAKVLAVSAPPKSGGPVPEEKNASRCSAHRRAFSGRGVTVGKNQSAVRTREGRGKASAGGLQSAA